MKVKLDPGAYAPKRAHDTDAGLDIRTPSDFEILPGGSATIYTGIHVQLPPNTAGVIMSKSGLNMKDGLTTTGLIDEGYDGEIVVKLYRHSQFGRMRYFNRGDKIAQLVVIPVLYEDVEVVDEIQGGARGADAFGSTGR